MSTTTQLDANQVIKRVYDEDTGSLKVVGLDPIVSRLAADTDSISIGDATATNFLTVNPDGSINITDNGTPLAVTDGGTPLLVSDGGTPLTVTDGGTPLVVTDGGTPIAITDGGVPLLFAPAVVDTTTLLNAHDASLDITTSAVNILAYRVVGVMANWASLDQTDATLQFQGSIDDVIYENVGSPTTLSTAAGNQSYSLIDEPYKWMKLVYVHGTNTTGTVTIKYILRA